MSHVKEMSNVLIDSVLLGNLRMFAFEEEKPKVVVHEPEVDQFDPPDPITSEKLKDINYKLGMIYTCFPDGELCDLSRIFQELIFHHLTGRGKAEYNHYPESYYTLSPKEKLLLVFAENFRRQFKEFYPTRQPLVLAVENECKVQKFVSTTICPTTFIEFPELIDNWQACANFVADHIVYEPLEEATNIVSFLLFFSLFLSSQFVI